MDSYVFLLETEERGRGGEKFPWKSRWKDRTIMPPSDLTPYATCLIVSIFSAALCQTNCPATCLCHLDQIPSTVMCAGQGLDEFPRNMSDLVWAKKKEYINFYMIFLCLTKFVQTNFSFLFFLSSVRIEDRFLYHSYERMSHREKIEGIIRTISSINRKKTIIRFDLPR